MVRDVPNFDPHKNDKKEFSSYSDHATSIEPHFIFRDTEKNEKVLEPRTKMPKISSAISKCPRAHDFSYFLRKT